MNNNVFDNLDESVIPLEGQDNNEQTENQNQESVPQNDGQEQEDNTDDGVMDWQKEYKSPEDMYKELKNTKKSYDNLRPKFTQISQELSSLKKGSTSKTTPQQVDTTGQTQSNDPVEIIANYIDSKINPLKEQSDELLMQNTILTLSAKHPDFVELAPDISQLLENEPGLWNTKSPLEAAYKIVKADKLANEVGTEIEKARKEAYADKELKVLNSESKAKPNTNTSTKKTASDDIADSIIDAYVTNRGVF